MYIVVSICIFIIRCVLYAFHVYRGKCQSRSQSLWSLCPATRSHWLAIGSGLSGRNKSSINNRFNYLSCYKLHMPAVLLNQCTCIVKNQVYTKDYPLTLLIPNTFMSICFILKKNILLDHYKNIHIINHF